MHTDGVEAREFYRQELAAHAGRLPDGVPVVELSWRHSWLPQSPGPGYELQTHKRLARWYYRIELGERRVELDCVGNRTAIPMAWHMLVEPCLRYLASMRGNLMLHGAAVVWAGKSLVLTGKGGAGKTSTSSLILRHGPEWKLHSDDYVFLSPDRISHAFGTRAHAYLDLLKWVPGLRSRLSPRERLEIGVFGWLRRLSRERIKLPLRLPLQRLWPGRELNMVADLGALMLLGERTDGELDFRRLNADGGAADALIEMNFDEAQHFIRLARKYLGRQRADSEVADWRAREHRALSGILLEVPAYLLRVPSELGSDPGAADRLVTELRGILERSEPQQ